MKMPFIWTECVNCGKVANIALLSFLKYHPDIKINVFGTLKDFEVTPKHDNIKYWNIESDLDVINGYKNGHLGTAILWAKLIHFRPERHLLHFDSDLVFRGSIVYTLLEKISEGYDLIGAVRNYKHNLSNIDNVRYLPDVVATGLFAFNREKVTPYPHDIMIKMCQGSYNPENFPTIDFFDPISFDITLKNKGKIFFLSSDEVGGCNNQGSRDNAFKQYNNDNTPYKLEFGSSLAHFSGVGSGCNFYHNPQNIGNVPKSYVDYCLDRYALFCKIFYNEDLGIDLSQYKNILAIKDWY